MINRGRRWYAIEYAYGRDVVNKGNRADHVHAFASRAERDAWVDAQERAGKDADALSGTHPLVQRARRYHKAGLPWPVPVMSGE